MRLSINSLARSSALRLLGTGSAFLFVILCAACGPMKTGGGGTGTTGGGGETPKADRAAGLTAFETVRAVFQHPRCQNCHPAGDIPLQGDDGRLHNQNVRRGPKGEGMVGAECSTCHGPANPPASYGRFTPPGNVKGWHMPPPEMKMVFVGMSPRALCEQVKDPARNGGKDMAALRHHLDDPLVVWGWSPGFGRAPIPTPRETLIAAWETWASAGAPCPE
jgi:hypothetical protein